ncbi:MAG: RimK family alpha-L-glutamate ligase [Synergistaceae bacterium]|jgi:ribosomal protein S6--L-glutamate ligase/tetrahydromethanopterin:alpha-L-glutamate ligase|nr:RimK family alpha-L-glutamate ligase [Synergistaceae bacterium]
MSPSHGKIGILGTAKGEQTILLQRALKARGAAVQIIHPKKLSCWLPGETVGVTAAEETVRLLDLRGLVVRWLPGGSLEQVVFRLNALHRLEQSGLRVINSVDTLERTVDKYYTTSLLASTGLPVPRTLVTERYDDAMRAVREWGSVVIKPVFGSQGQGMVRVDDPNMAHRVLRALEMGRYLYYVQEYLPHEGVDYRLFVIDGRVTGAMRRRSENWCTNIACGGQAEPFEAPDSFCQLALAASDLLGADYLGVDILCSEGSPYLLEANGIPGWLGLQTVLKCDIADELAAFILGVC